jgi:hypothetical protein
MMNDKLNGNAMCQGRVRAVLLPDAFNPLEPVRRSLTGWCKNDVLFGWAGNTGKLLTQGATNYRISGMYLEFENNAGAPVPVPAFDRSGGLSYYQQLAASPTRDYIRVPITAATLESSDEVLFPDGNVMTFFAQTRGTEGVHGKPFSDAVDSRIYGGGLVAIVDEADDTQDIVFSRFYFEAADQQIKLPSSQIGLEWEITLQ